MVLLAPGEASADASPGPGRTAADAGAAPGAPAPPGPAEPPPPAWPAPPSPSPSPSPSPKGVPRLVGRGPEWLRPVGAGLTLLALGLVAFVVDIGVVSHLEHARSQRVAYADLRSELANATAPTGQVGQDGAVLPLGTGVALLSAPRLGLDREVVGEGTTSAVLARGPGHLRSSVLPGQPGTSVVYGRAWAYGGPFSRLRGALPGDELTVLTGQGEHTYRVTGVREEGDPLPPVLAATDGEGRLTLVTATGSALVPTGVLYVDADLTSPAVQAPRRVISSSLLGPGERALATDTGALVPGLLLTQALLVAVVAITWCSRRWTGRQTWLVAVPVLTTLVLLVAREAVRLLPNLV